MVFTVLNKLYVFRFSRLISLFLLLGFVQGCAMTCGNHDATVAPSKEARMRAPIIENRFIANGRVTRVEKKEGRISSFWMIIAGTEPIAGYENFGPSYKGEEVKVKSVIELPFGVGNTVSLVLRVAGDEYGQSLFLVAVKSV